MKIKLFEAGEDENTILISAYSKGGKRCRLELPQDGSKGDTMRAAGSVKSIRASVQRKTVRKQGQAGRAVVIGRSMERCEAVNGRSSYNLLVSVNLLIRYSPLVVTPPAGSPPSQ